MCFDYQNQEYFSSPVKMKFCYVKKLKNNENNVLNCFVFLS